MSGADSFSPTIRKLRLLLAQCEAMKQRSKQLSADTERMIRETEKRIEECIQQLGSELKQRD